MTQRNLAIADAVNELAAERDASSAQVAIAWVRAQQQRATVIPIVGARTSTQIQVSLGAVDIELSAEEIDRLEQQSRIDLGFPHDFAGRALAHGTTFELVDDQRRHVYTQDLCSVHPRAGRGGPADDRRLRRHVRQPDLNCEPEVAAL